jgi:hypothetical protein
MSDASDILFSDGLGQRLYRLATDLRQDHLPITRRWEYLTASEQAEWDSAAVALVKYHEAKLRHNYPKTTE